MTAEQVPSRTPMTSPFAQDGARAYIDATDTNNMNFPKGFPDVFGAPGSQGGKYLQRSELNSLGHIATNDLFYHKCGGINTFDQEFASAVGGYPKGAVLQYLNGTNLYFIRSLVDNNMVNPETAGIDGINWKFCYQSQSAEEIDDTFIAHIDTTLSGSLTACSLLYGGRATRDGVITIRNLAVSMEQYYTVNTGPNFFIGQGLLIAANSENNITMPTTTSSAYNGWTAFSSFGTYALGIRQGDGGLTPTFTPTFGMKECVKGDYFFVAGQSGYDVVRIDNNSWASIQDLKISFDIYII